jgi:hypothetical protein
MTTFRVLINGRNFHLKRDGKPEHLGFYTTRFVNAESQEEVEALAVESIRKDTWLKESTFNSKDDPPMLYAEEIEAVGNQSQREVTGFSFYPAADDAKESD